MRNWIYWPQPSNAALSADELAELEALNELERYDAMESFDRFQPFKLNSVIELKLVEPSEGEDGDPYNHTGRFSKPLIRP